MILHDVHMHCFNVEDVPMQTFLRRFGIIVSIMIRNFKSTTKDDKLREFSDSIERKRSDIIYEYVEGMINFVSKSKDIPGIEKFVVCPLTIDFSGESKIKEFVYQIKKLEEALNERQWTQFEFRPFLGISFDNRHDVSFLKKYIDLEKGPFYGIKIYGPLGFDVGSALDSIVLRYAEDNRIPVTTHCSDGGFPSMHITRAKAKKFSHPNNWIKILDRMPELKLNLAHMGGLKKSWVNKIQKACFMYENVFTDISYVINDRMMKHRFKEFKKDYLSSKVLFGTDWFMAAQKELTIDSLCRPFIDSIQPDDIRKIMDENPRKFLYNE